MATQIVELTGDEQKLLKSLDNVIQKQLEYERKLRDTGVQGDAAGIQIKEALAKVEAEAEKTLKGLLKELNSLGPEGRQASEELRKHLVEAGKISEKSIESVVAKLDMFDPESAKAGRAIVENLKNSSDRASKAIVDGMDDAADGSAKAIDKLSDHAAVKFGAMALGYKAVQIVAKAINDLFETQLDLIERARAGHLTLADAQQETWKNLINFTPEERKYLADVVPKQIQAKTGFPSQAALTTAIGEAGSSAKSAQQIEGAATIAAKVTQRTPESVDEYTKGVIAIMNSTGLPAEEAMAFLLQGGGKALLTNPADVAKVLPTALNSGFATSKVTDANRMQVAQETSGVFATFTELGMDDKGDSARTNETQFLGFMADMTANLPDDPGTPMGRLIKIQSSPELREQFIDKLPGEQRFKHSVRKFMDPASREFKLLKEKTSGGAAGTEVIDQLLGELKTGTDAMIIGGLEAASTARSQLSETLNVDGALLGQIRKTVGGALTDNQPWYEHALDSAFSFGGMLTPMTVAGGRLEGSTAAEEGVAGIRELGVLRANTVDPQKRENLSIAIEALAEALISSKGLDAAGAGRAIDQIARPANDLRADGTTEALLTEIKSALQIIASNTSAANPQPATGAVNNLQP